jgi:hypothetical protein
MNEATAITSRQSNRIKMKSAFRGLATPFPSVRAIRCRDILLLMPFGQGGEDQIAVFSP